MWLEIIENARASESRSGNKYGTGGGLPPGLAKFIGQNQNRSGGVVAASMDSKNNFYYDNQDESLDNYLEAQDAEAVTDNKSYAQPDEYYYTGK